MKPQPRPHRRWLALAVASTALLLGGCVYLRLLELKLQLGKFEKFFTIQTDNGLALVCLTPILRSNDIRWIGVKPEHTRRIGRAEQWHVRWVKQLPPDQTEEKEFDIALDMSFVEDRLTRVAIPERYFEIMPKAFLVGVIKSLGKGRIDKAGKKIESAISAEEIARARPNLPGIDRLLGKPSDEREEGATTITRYRYVPATKEPRAGTFEMQLRFHTKSGELLEWVGLTPVGRIGFNFTADQK